MLNCLCQLRLGAARLESAPYRFRSRGTRDHTRRVTVAAEPHKTVSLFCRWFLSRFSSAVGNWLQCHASFLGKHIVQVSGALPVKSGFGVL